MQAYDTNSSVLIVIVDVGHHSGGMNKYTRMREPTVKGIPWLPELLLATPLGVSVPQSVPPLHPFSPGFLPNPGIGLFSWDHRAVFYGHILTTVRTQQKKDTGQWVSTPCLLALSFSASILSNPSCK